jgi:hypothetical protein
MNYLPSLIPEMPVFVPVGDGMIDRGRDEGMTLAPPSEPDGRISRIRLSGRWSHVGDRLAYLRAEAREINPSSVK